ncbi:MAG: hypothetical protein QM820_61650 [Minicystis sp.]
MYVKIGRRRGSTDAATVEEAGGSRYRIADLPARANARILAPMMPSLRAGTLGAYLAAGISVKGARAPALQRTAQLERLALAVEAEEIGFALAVTVEERGSSERLTHEERFGRDAWPDCIELSVNGGERERARGAIERWLGEDGQLHAEDLFWRLLDALIPAPPAPSLFTFVAERGLALVNGDAGAIARTETKKHAVVLQATELVVGSGARDLGQVRLVVSVEKRLKKSGEIIDVLEQEVFWGRIGVSAHRLSEPDFASPPLAGWLAAWRAYLSRRLARLAEEHGGQLPMPMDVISGRTLFNLAQFWLEEGPPPEATPRLRIEPEAIDRALAGVRAIPLPKIRARLRGRGLPTVQLALALGRHTVVLCAGTASDRLGDDRVLLLSDDEEPITLLRADQEIQNRLLYTLDGDADTMRRLLRWLSELVVRAHLDGEIAAPLSERHRAHQDLPHGSVSRAIAIPTSRATIRGSRRIASSTRILTGIPKISICRPRPPPSRSGSAASTCRAITRSCVRCWTRASRPARVAPVRNDPMSRRRRTEPRERSA